MNLVEADDSVRPFFLPFLISYRTNLINFSAHFICGKFSVNRGVSKGAIAPFGRIHTEGVERGARVGERNWARRNKQRLYCIRKEQKHLCFCSLTVLMTTPRNPTFF